MVTEETKRTLSEQFKYQKHAHDSDPYPDIRQRKTQLQTLYQMLVNEKERIADAIHRDFGQRSRSETFLLELLPSLECIKHAKKHVKKWMKPEKRSSSLWFKTNKNKVFYQPLGVVGIIVPWNYPLYLAVGPIVSALSAGNRVMVKMSEHTPNTGQLLAELFNQYFDSDLISVFNGGPEVGMAFSQLPFDHLLFTGSTAVGKHIMHAASENLTPVTLELGGKSPAILADDFPITKATSRILAGKLFNAGQTCVAPDYLFIHRSQLSAFIETAKTLVNTYYPNFLENEDYTNIISLAQVKRLKDYLVDATEKGATLISLTGSSLDLDTTSRKVPPCLIADVNADMKIMKEEIFGPFLPIVPFEEMNDVIRTINASPKPLALYLFSNDQKHIDNILHCTSSGGVCINNTLLHVIQDDLPFGGVGASGIGHYHGKDGFETFSKKKGVHIQGAIDLLKYHFPPFTQMNRRLLKWMMKI